MNTKTIEQKAAAYDEAIEVMRQWAAPCHTKEQLETMKKSVFPELAESEDEKIRKECISIIRAWEQLCLKEGDACEVAPECIVWLEKQKDSYTKNQLKELGFGFDLNGDIIPAYMMYEAFKLAYKNKQRLEKQGKQKSVEWNIQGAIKGDILSNGTIVLIFDSVGKFEGRDIINSWYYADPEKFYGKGTSECDQWETECFRPASEAEKNYLFKMMNDAGYTWDSAKNQLLDIEKPVEWSEEDIEFLVKSYSDNIPVCGDFQSYHDALVDSYEQGVRSAIAYKPLHSQPKPEWSDEDESMLQNILECLKHGWKKLPTDILKYESWLKSLKDKCLPQPKQEWSEEDEYYRGIILYCLDGVAVGALDKKNAISWLKSLRPQKQWKPTKEQMEALRVAKAYPSSERREILETLYEDLEQLKAL